MTFLCVEIPVVQSSNPVQIRNNSEEKGILHRNFGEWIKREDPISEEIGI